ncbi:MAG: Ribosomal-protein-alanine acetyltransferase [Candidatus Tokpelaia hoelldobleri]|uniref:Ribosomal-protein-alanine acetyltransferase n=1 Tax=Candidatus Tokpelaia hoelldobleri TaxID=1902579 RepID=A0A1U9JWA7_9HYPH|nr:MAG: Ribosomal-protein-alanine acetyltransferase [Candidatus Tokpelaia hoelldoblerii]
MAKLFSRRSEISLARLEPDDSDSLQQLHARVFPPGWDAAAFANFLHDPHGIGFAARTTDKPKKLNGFVLERQVAGEAEILSIAVAPESRRKGIGHALMDALLRQLYQERVQTLFLEVDEHNRAARALYRHFGFVETGRRSGYYQSAGKRTDALILRRDFKHPDDRLFNEL